MNKLSFSDKNCASYDMTNIVKKLSVDSKRFCAKLIRLSGPSWDGLQRSYELSSTVIDESGGNQ